MSNQPLLSLITVTFNGEKLVEPTMKMVSEQTFTDYEIIVIDGGSKDNTIEAFKTYRDKIGYIISEPDNGIYDAMNKGIAAAKGKWIYFMNLGDEFCSNTVLSDIFEKQDVSQYDMVYGNALTVGDPTSINKVIGKEAKLSDYYFGIPLCHQAIFAKKTTFNTVGDFDLKFKSMGDIEWQVRVFKNQQLKTLYLPINIAYYEVVGYSYINRMQGIREAVMAGIKNFNPLISLLLILRYPLMVIKVNLIKLLQNSPLLKQWRKLKYRNKQH